MWPFSARLVGLIWRHNAILFRKLYFTQKCQKNTDKMTHKHIFFLRQTCTTITNYENSVVNWIVKARLFAILVWSGKNILIFYKKKKKLVKLNNVYFQKIQFDQRVYNNLIFKTSIYQWREYIIFFPIRLMY